jgi:hypothetical protein
MRAWESRGWGRHQHVDENGELTLCCDGLGRRIGKFVDDNEDTVTDRSETFIHDGAALLSPFPRFGGERSGCGGFS